MCLVSFTILSSLAYLALIFDLIVYLCGDLGMFYKTLLKPILLP